MCLGAFCSGCKTCLLVFW
ncbi:hypothetical protein CFP56_015739 [Quercus suber]|uniref:Uncharacterized protein n=1 Tax=Quercus suber TaxID=58331 RepID=A0AAW0KPJ7_QUESU